MSVVERRRRFSELVAAGVDPVAAAVRAGYVESRARVTASELLRRGDVQGWVREAQREDEERRAKFRVLLAAGGEAREALVGDRARVDGSMVDRGWIVSRLREVVEDADSSPAARVSALGLLMKLVVVEDVSEAVVYNVDFGTELEQDV